jgi:hypothetical protein
MQWLLCRCCLPEIYPSAPPPSLLLQVVSNNLSPTWKPCKVAMASLCNCDEHRPLLLEVCGPATAAAAQTSRLACHWRSPAQPNLANHSCLQVFDSDGGGSHELIGQCETSLQQMQAAAAQGQGLPLVNPKKRGQHGYLSSGALPAVQRPARAVCACRCLHR